MRYRASKRDCQTCHLKLRCCPKVTIRWRPSCKPALVRAG